VPVANDTKNYYGKVKQKFWPEQKKFLTGKASVCYGSLVVTASK
jgi:hypothetical protein